MSEITSITTSCDGDGTSTRHQFEIQTSGTFGPHIVLKDGGVEPEIGFDVFYDHVQALIFEAGEDEPSVNIRYEKGRIVEIAVDARLRDKVLCEDITLGPSLWMQNRDAAERAALSSKK